MRQSSLNRLARAERIAAKVAPRTMTAAARIAALQALVDDGHLVRTGADWIATDDDPNHEAIAEILTRAEARRRAAIRYQ